MSMLATASMTQDQFASLLCLIAFVSFVIFAVGFLAVMLVLQARRMARLLACERAEARDCMRRRLHLENAISLIRSELHSANVDAPNDDADSLDAMLAERRAITNVQAILDIAKVKE